MGNTYQLSVGPSLQLHSFLSFSYLPLVNTFFFSLIRKREAPLKKNIQEIVCAFSLLLMICVCHPFS